MDTDDEGMRKGVIDQMMGELDDVTADSLRKPKAPVSGVEIAITVSPKSGEAMKEELGEEGKEACDVEGCEDPMHDHSERDAEPQDEGDGDYINHLIKKLG